MQYVEKKLLLTVSTHIDECQPMLAFDVLWRMKLLQLSLHDSTLGCFWGKEASDPCGHSSRLQTAASTANETRCKLKEGLTCLDMDMQNASITI